jgi:RPA family protein
MSKKCFNCHINKNVVQTENGLELFTLPVEFVWVQGIVTNICTETGQFSVDDGTGCLMVIASAEMLMELTQGSYVLVHASLNVGEDEISGDTMVALMAVLVSPIIDPNMETLWFLEVMDAQSRWVGGAS